MADVVTIMPSKAPDSTTLVSPVTTGTLASSEYLPTDFITRSRASISRPSSRTTAKDIARGVAPMTAISLTVPLTDREPMSPPGKNSGFTV